MAEVGRLDEWRFCPRCGAAIEPTGRRAVCAACGFVEWANAAPAVEALVVDRDRVLLARRGVEPHAGMWDLPGGFLEEGEEPLEGLRRELREETGLEIEPVEFLGTAYSPYERWTVLILRWLVRPVSGSACAADDVAELVWVSPGELPPAGEFAFPSHVEALSRWAHGGPGRPAC